jgi:xylulokinase
MSLKHLFPEHQSKIENPKSPMVFLGSDIGTGSCKTVVIDDRGTVVARAAATYSCSHPEPGWVEQDPEDWFAAFCMTTRQVLATTHQLLRTSGLGPVSMAAVCIAGVTHNPVLLDGNDNLLRPAIHFWDKRSVEQVEQIKVRWGDEVRLRACNEVDPLWTWPQLLWLREHEPDVWGRIAHLLFPKDYVRHRLVPSSSVTDTIDPAGTLLYDPRTSTWIAPFVSDLGLSHKALPVVRPPMSLVGYVGEQGVAASGLALGTPVLTGTTDTAAEVIGSGALNAGQAILKLASVGRIMLVMERPLDDPHSLNYPHVFEGLWYPGSVIKHGASSYRWAKQLLWPELEEGMAYRQMDQAAAAVPAGCEGLLFHPHLSGEYAPQWDPRLRASFTGLTLRHSRDHMTRAVLEGVAFQIRAALEQIEDAGGAFHELRLIGGGATSLLWSQIMADVLGHRLLVPAEQAAAYGAALLAGMAVGLLPGEGSDLAERIQIRRQIRPEPTRVALYERLYDLYRKVGASQTESSHILNNLSGLFAKFG